MKKLLVLLAAVGLAGLVFVVVNTRRGADDVAPAERLAA
jgi:hypothetical protein